MSRRTRYDTGLGRRVTELIARGKTTQAGMAIELGVPRASLNQMLTGRMRAHDDLEARVERLVTQKEEGK
jgi:plasmid maintenance system antidote protein VapI